MNRSIKQFRQRGMSMAPVMLFALGFTVMGVSVMSLSMVHNKGAKKTTDKWQSDNLAESAVNVLYDRIRLQMISDLSYPFQLNQETVRITKPDGNQEEIGIYSARLVADREVQTDVKENGQDLRKYSYFFTIEGRGQAYGGVESVIRVKFRGDIYRHLVPRSTYATSPPPSTFSFPFGAIVSNTTVNITTNQGLRTYAPNGRDAHVMANQGITWQPTTGTKSSFTNPNILDIQGYYLVPDGTAYSNTVGAGGLGNSNGTKNYRSPEAVATGTFPGAPANSVIKLENSVRFADYTTVDGWKGEWWSNATGTGTTNFAGSVGSDTLTPRGTDGKVGIQTPATIDGDLTVKPGQKIHLWPASTNPKKNVVYIRGNIANAGQLVNHGVTVVFDGKYTDTSTAEYKLEPDTNTFRTNEEVMQKSSLLSTNQANDAFTFSTNASSTTGVIYALKGGIKVSSANAEFTGMLLAGGIGSDGGIDISPGGGNSFVVKFDPYMAQGGDVVMDEASQINQELVPGNIARSFSPTKLFNWVNLK